MRPPNGIRRVGACCWAVARNFVGHDGLQSAGYIAFTAFIGLFPFVSFLLSLASFVGREDAALRFVDFMFEVVPTEVAEGLGNQLRDLVATPRGGLLTASAVVTLWVASSGVEALRQALNHAYGVRPRRPFWWRRLENLAIVIGGAGVILGAMIGLLAVPLAQSVLTEGGAHATLGTWLPVRLIIIGLIACFVVSVFYRWLPAAPLRWHRVVPGALLCTALWGGGTAVFSVYLARIADYSLVYGSLSSFIVVLVFFYFLGFAFVIGAELNAELERRRHRASGESHL